MMNDRAQKIFIISLDGATFDVLVPLMKQGYMPNLAAMMSTGTAAELESVVPPVTAPAWTSFMTGKHAGKHGIFDFTRFDPETCRWSINNAQHIRSKTLWQILTEKGKRSIVLNLPYTYPPYEIDGIMVSGWDAPASETTFSVPSDVSAEILRRFPDYRENLWVSDLMPLTSDQQFEEFTGKLKNGSEQQTDIALDLLAREEWDVFMIHFQQTDWIQHKLWEYIEKGCQDSSDHSSKIEQTRACYQHFDRLVGVLLKQVETLRPSTIVLSDHGFGRLMGNIYPNQYLQDWGYLVAKNQQQDKLKSVKDVFRKSRYAGLRKFYKKVAEAKASLAGSQVEETHDSWVDNAADVLSGRGRAWDWSRTKAAVVYAYQMGFVFVNVVGRGPSGIVEPGSQYEQVVNDLIVRFREIRHPLTGQKLIADVVRGSEVYPSSADGVTLPDLLLLPVDGYNFSFTLSDAVPEVSEEGTHRHNGVVFIQGEELLRRPKNFSPNLIDLAPTILHLLDLPVPSDMDGRVLEELFTTSKPVGYEDVDNTVTQQSQDYTGEEAELIEQRLKGLGYLE
jgi:predicted AlkP superfamily phosphohydrolase/phosphomutase